MASQDQKTSLPVRSEADGTDERLHAKLVDYASPAGIEKQLEISEKLAHVRVFARDPAGTKVQMELAENGSVKLDGEYNVVTNSKPSTTGLMGHSRNIAPAASQLGMRVTAIQSTDGLVRSVDMSLHDHLGNPFTPNNPVPVSLEESPGDEIVDYHESAVAIAANASENRDYTVTVGTVLLIEQVKASASGKMRVELQVETGIGTGIYNTVAVFFNSVPNPDINEEFARPKKVGAGIKVRLVKKNLDNQAMTLYSTLIGMERTP